MSIYPQPRWDCGPSPFSVNPGPVVLAGPVHVLKGRAVIPLKLRHLPFQLRPLFRGKKKRGRQSFAADTGTLPERRLEMTASHEGQFIAALRIAICPFRGKPPAISTAASISSTLHAHFTPPCQASRHGPHEPTLRTKSLRRVPRTLLADQSLGPPVQNLDCRRRLCRRGIACGAGRAWGRPRGRPIFDG